MKTTEIPVYCWYCGKRFEIEISNVYAGHLFCSDKCREENLKEEIKLEKKGRRQYENKRWRSQEDGPE